MKEGTSEKQHSASGTAVVVKQQHKIDLTLSTVSIDVFCELIKELSFTEIARLHLAARVALKSESKAAKVILDRLHSDHAVKSIWLPYLKILKQMDSGIPLEPPSNVKNKGAWYYTTVMHAALAIYKRQNDEFAYLKRRQRIHHRWADIADKDINDEEVTLELLMVRHQRLDVFNELIIRNRIDFQSNELDLFDLGITRIPECLFSDESLSEYWRNLLNLDCTHNQLQQLPDALGNLVALERFYCDHNQLQQLPEGFRTRFGQAWADQTLRFQRRPAAPAILPQFAAANPQHPQGVKREERSSGTVEPEEAARDNTKRKKR